MFLLKSYIIFYILNLYSTKFTDIVVSKKYPRLKFSHFHDYENFEGELTTKKNWLFLAIILDGVTHICSGSLIKPQWVLTAASCGKESNKTYGINHEITHVALGNYKIGLKKSSEIYYPDYHKYKLNTDSVLPTVWSGVKIKITKIYPHENYIPSYKSKVVNKNDICLLKLEKMDLIKDVATARFGSMPRIGSLCKICGWGLSFIEFEEYSPEIIYSESLFELNVGISKSKIMLSTVEEWSGNDLNMVKLIEYYKVMVESTVGNSEIIHMTDVGGPLVCNGSIVGIASTKIKKLTSITPIQYKKYVLYTRVDRYMRWIQNRTSDSGKNNSTPSLRNDSHILTVLTSKGVLLYDDIIYFCALIYVIRI